MRLRTALSAAVASTSLALAFALAAAPSAGAADVPGFSGTWLESALRTQYDLGGDLAFKDAPLLGTHNSFNSQEEMGAELSPFEINQQLDLTDQLDIYQVWPKAPVDPLARKYPTTSVPILMMNGDLDMQTPIDTASLVSARFPLSRADEGLRRAAEPGVRKVLLLRE